jgi:zinc/manganese transport system substrate-binding protein
MRIILKMALTCLLVGGLLGGCATKGPAAAGGPVRVVVAENFWGSIVEQLAGPSARVTSVISSPATDPHDYEPTAADARSIASAQYVVLNGIGYDAWMQQLLDANPVRGRIVLNVGDLLGLRGGANPHQWYSAAAVHRVVARVGSDLARVDPSHRAAYRGRTRSFDTAGLRGYDALLAEIRAKYAGAPIGASESVVLPLAASAGLRVVTPVAFLDAVAEGNEPTESEKAKVDAEISGRTIAVFVYNRQNATPDVRRLVDAARRAHIPVATVTETLVPAHTSFQAWQTRQLRALLGALDRGARR